MADEDVRKRRNVPHPHTNLGLNNKFTDILYPQHLIICSAKAFIISLIISKISLEPVNFKLKVVTGENVKIIGQISVKVRYKHKEYILPLIVLDSIIKFTPLLGRNWLNIINPNWKRFLVKQTESIVGNISESKFELEK